MAAYQNIAQEGAKITAFDTAITGLKREIALLREYRTRLEADVVPGQLDVRPAAARLPAIEVATPPAVAADDEADLAEEAALE